MLLSAILALVELKTPTNLHQHLGACMAQGRAEYAAVHFESPLPHAADIDVPVILTDMIDMHIIQQSLPQHRGQVTCSTISDAAVASGYIKQLLSAKLSTRMQRVDDIVNFRSELPLGCCTTGPPHHFC